MKQFTLITVLLASIAVAQSLSGEMTVVVPFPFVVGGAVLPSGHYVIRDHGTYLQISSTQTRNVLVPTHDALRSESNGSKLVSTATKDPAFSIPCGLQARTGADSCFRPVQRKSSRSVVRK